MIAASAIYEPGICCADKSASGSNWIANVEFVWISFWRKVCQGVLSVSQEVVRRISQSAGPQSTQRQGSHSLARRLPHPRIRLPASPRL